MSTYAEEGNWSASGLAELILIDYDINPEFSREGNPRTFEFVWSAPMGPGLYRFFHSPRWAKGLKLNDIVQVDENNVVVGLKESAEYRTVVIDFPEEYWNSQQWPMPAEEELVKIHCEMDWLGERSFLVSVHRKVSNEEIEALLKEFGNPTLEWVE